MKILNARFFSGPNIWFSQSGLHIQCELLPIVNFPSIFNALESDTLKLIHQGLLNAAPVFSESTAFANWRHWLESEQKETDWLLAITEIMARDFSWSPAMGKVLRAENSSVELFAPCNDEQVGLVSARFSAMLVTAFPDIVRDRTLGWVEKLANAYRSTRVHCRKFGLNQSNIALARCAHKRGIPVSRSVIPGQYVYLGQGVHLQETFETSTSKTSFVARNISSDKFLTSQRLHRFGLPTPNTVALNSTNEVKQVAKALGFPLVVKPRSSGKGEGVTVNINSEGTLEKAVQHALSFRKGLILERFIEGDDHRLLVVAGRLVAVAKRIPAHVVGDGKSSVRELIDELNQDPHRGMPFERLREKVLLDDEADFYLKRSGLTPNSVLENDQVVYLRGTANISRGGTSVDLTDKIHPDNREIAERAARIVGLDVAGIDFLTPDIGKSWREVPSAILEVNSTPGLRPHLGANPERDVCEPIVEHLFPKFANGRVPLVGVTGSLGKTTTTHLISAVLDRAGLCVARTTTQGAWVGQEEVKGSGAAGGSWGLLLLGDRKVEAGVFEITRKELLERGLFHDTLDVAVVLNILDNHIGLNGISSREDLAKVKSLLVQHAKQLVVLNADDTLCLAMREKSTAKTTALFSLNPDNPDFSVHRIGGGLCAYISGDRKLVWECNRQLLAELSLADVADARGGAFRPAVQHALVAGCVAHILDIDFSITLSVLKSYRSTVATNPGRTNHLTGLPYQLVLSHADGPEAIKELVNYSSSLCVDGERRLLICSAGDRTDSFIKNMGREAAGYFSKYICCDYKDLRGREAAEVPYLLANGLIEKGVPAENVFVIPSMVEAIKFAYQGLDANDLVVENTYGGKFDEEWCWLRGLSKEQLGGE